MRIALTLAALAATLHFTPAHAGAKYKLAPQNRAVKFGEFLPRALNDYGFAAGTIYPYSGDSLAYLSAGSFFSADDFCGILGEAGGTDLAGISRDSAVTYIAGNCTSQNDGYLYNGVANVTTSVRVPGAAATIVAGVSNNGRVGGTYFDSNFQGFGFYFEDGNYVPFAPPGSTGMSVESVSPAGDFTGYYSTADGVLHGFILVGTSFTTIDYPGAFLTVITGLNSQNLAVGTGYLPGNVTQAFAWQDGSFRLPPLPPNTYSGAVSVSETDIVAGSYLIAAPSTYGGYAWKPDDKVILVNPPPGATDMNVAAVNSTHGQVTGSYISAANKVTAFIATCHGTACFSP